MPDATKRLPKLLNFMRAMWGVGHGLQAQSKRMQRAVGLTGPQRLVVRIVGRFPDISAGELAEVLHLHPSTLTGIVRRLQTQKILKRASDTKDARRALFTLTTAGRKYDVKHPRTVEAIVERSLGRFSDAEVETARRVLDALATSLSESA